MHILLGDGKGIAVCDHFIKRFKAVLVFILVDHFISVCVIDGNHIFILMPVSGIMIAVLSGIAEFQHAIFDIPEVMVFSLSVYPVLPDKVSIRQQPFIDFIFSVREFIRNGGFAVFIEFKGIVGTLRVDGLCVWKKAIQDILGDGAARSKGFFVFLVCQIRISFIPDENLCAFQRNLFSGFGVYFHDLDHIFFDLIADIQLIAVIKEVSGSVCVCADGVRSICSVACIRAVCRYASLRAVWDSFRGSVIMLRHDHGCSFQYEFWIIGFHFCEFIGAVRQVPQQNLSVGADLHAKPAV